PSATHAPPLHAALPILSRMTEDAQRTFLIITGVVNSIFFPLGFVLVAWLSRAVLMVPRGLRKGRRYDAQTLRRARNDALLLGERDRKSTRLNSSHVKSS